MYLLLDIGGTKIRVGVSEDLSDIDNHQIIKTPPDFEGGIDIIKKTAANLAKGKPFIACAAGIREVLDHDKGSLVNDPKYSLFPNWVGKPIKQALEHEFSSKVYLENDAAMAALGEAGWGSGHGFGIVAYITISTGLGGSRIVNGKIDQNYLGFEPGEQVINYLGELVYLGDVASGFDIQKKYGQKPQDIDDPGIWKNVNKALSIGLYNITALWSPEVIILGGGMINRLSIDDLSTGMKTLNRKYPKLPILLKANLGDLSGLYGCLEYLKQFI